MNNSAYLLDTWNYHSIIPVFTFDWLLKFPVIGALVAGGADALTDKAIYMESLLTAGVNPEFNNPGGMLCPILDYGIVGGLTFWVLSGFLLGKIYNLFRRGALAGQLFYPLAVLSLMEIPRLLYWTGGRAFPTLVFLAATTVIVKDTLKRARGNSERFARPAEILEGGSA
jgi:hypothetical protein